MHDMHPDISRKNSFGDSNKVASNIYSTLGNNAVNSPQKGKFVLRILPFNKALMKHIIHFLGTRHRHRVSVKRNNKDKLVSNLFLQADTSQPRLDWWAQGWGSPFLRPDWVNGRQYWVESWRRPKPAHLNFTVCFQHCERHTSDYSFDEQNAFKTSAQLWMTMTRQEKLLQANCESAGFDIH